MNPEALKGLTEQAENLAYEYILHSGLYKQLENEQWDLLAEQIGAEIISLTERMVTKKETELSCVETKG